MSEAPTEDPSEPPLHSASEAAALVAGAIAVVLASRGLVALAPAVGSFSSVFLVLGCVVPAYALALRRGRDPLRVHAVLVRPQRLGLGVGVSAFLLGGFLLAVELAARGQGWTAEALEAGPVVARFGNDLLTVAIAEEYLFRGVAQPAWDPAGGPRRKLLGVPFGRGALLSALVFGLVHPLVWLNPALVVIVLPGLWFAWLRAASGSVVLCALAHAAANTLQQVCLTRFPELPSLLPWVG